ncbi:single-stranded DNA-binding protein [Isoptericola variabilis]|uniref:Single-stranded DNA-binding protein n=1 Tax=Isoptericola variabilis (strain 225) TaxID=743718 RepID=F6FQG2_ISOV2|nr:single-stranded DNA-binding protein [Isoptericola variabilis]AEG43837.1 single-strand binding protein [Isoptericola variabilis 225]TWH34139.1 single-strand DNA-binding protein [Isoptericola variabilis J7]
MSDVNVTVVGHVGTDAGLSVSTNGVEWTTFRLASTRRVRNPQTGEWSDGETLWFTVKAFREKARNLSFSLRKGDPVVVTGRFTTEEWDAERVHTLPDGSTVTLPERRYRHVIEAQHVGVDATRGVVRFARIDRTDAPAGAGPGGPGTGAAATGGPGDDVPVPGTTASLVDPWQVRVPDDASGLADDDADGADELEGAEPVGA